MSFVTALSTGITTVSLMDKSDQGVTQTIYRVVEKTIEKVAPDSPVRKIVEVPKTDPKETVLSISDIAEKAGASLVRIYRKVADKNEFVSLGIKVGSKGAIIAFNGGEFSTAESYSVSFGKEFVPLAFSKKINTSVSVFLLDTKDISKIPSASYVSSKNIKLGANVIALGGREDNNIVSTGIVKEFGSIKVSESASATTFVTDLKPSSNLSSFVLLSTNAEILGFYFPSSLLEGTAEGSYLDAGELLSTIKELL